MNRRKCCSIKVFSLVLNFQTNYFYLSPGITNGIDVAEWDPSSDEHIACHYSAENLNGKVANYFVLKLVLYKTLAFLPQLSLW